MTTDQLVFFCHVFCIFPITIGVGSLIAISLAETQKTKTIATILAVVLLPIGITMKLYDVANSDQPTNNSHCVRSTLDD